VEFKIQKNVPSIPSDPQNNRHPKDPRIHHKKESNKRDNHDQEKELFTVRSEKAEHQYAHKQGLGEEHRGDSIVEVDLAISAGYRLGASVILKATDAFSVL
jgi:hypothetical protein